jgi:hypothetical protein
MSSVRCPICGKLFEPDETSPMPFCSERCRRVDLVRWFDQRYGVPADPKEEPEEPDPADPPS